MLLLFAKYRFLGICRHHVDLELELRAYSFLKQTGVLQYKPSEDCIFKRQTKWLSSIDTVWEILNVNTGYYCMPTSIFCYVMFVVRM